AIMNENASETTEWISSLKHLAPGRERTSVDLLIHSSFVEQPPRATEIPGIASVATFVRPNAWDITPLLARFSANLRINTIKELQYKPALDTTFSTLTDVFCSLAMCHLAVQELETSIKQK